MADVTLQQGEYGARILLGGNAIAPGKEVLLGEGGLEDDQLNIGFNASDGTYIVNPGNPAAYQNIQDALDAGFAAAPAGEVIIQVATGYDYSADLVIPQQCNVKIRSWSEYLFDTVISGTITWHAQGGSLVLENLYVTGAISGVAVNNNGRFIANHCAIDSTVTFTGGEVKVNANGYGWGNHDLQGYFGGEISTLGSVSLVDMTIYAAVTAALSITVRGCGLAGTWAFTTDATALQITDTIVANGVQTIVFSDAEGVVTADQFTRGRLLAGGAEIITNGTWSNVTSMPFQVAVARVIPVDVPAILDGDSANVVVAGTSDDFIDCHAVIMLLSQEAVAAGLNPPDNLAAPYAWISNPPAGQITCRFNASGGNVPSTADVNFLCLGIKLTF